MKVSILAATALDQMNLKSYCIRLHAAVPLSAPEPTHSTLWIISKKSALG